MIMMTYTKWEMENLPKIIRKRKMTLKNILYRYGMANAKHDIEQMVLLTNLYSKEDQLLQFNLKQLANVEAYNGKDQQRDISLA